MQLKSEASLQILKPIEVVFECIVNRHHLTQYFISESDADLEDGKNVVWKFPEFEERFPITEVKTTSPRAISFTWDPETRVTIELTPYDKESTVVKVTEGSKEMSEDNLKWLISNVGGWSNFLASMKAYLEYGVGLRKGAYDFMRK